ncbi:uncharacterized protein [Porites lutea]|uniref:uncharacterized protein n=1 Tax=Porites lutea TaxID=51062 RepID=UPI003CC616AB
MLLEYKQECFAVKLKTRVAGCLFVVSKNVIPSHVPLETEIRENSCVFTPGYHYVAGRVHEINGNKYRVEKLVDANRDYKGQTIRLHSFEREKLRVIFSAWCEKVEFFARVSKLRSKVSYGRIVSVDSKLVFLENAQGGLHRLSYKTQDAFFVSKREVRPDDVEPKKTKLWLPNMYGYLEPVTAPNKIILSLWIKRKPRIVWYKENDDKPDVCKNEAGLCYNSRIPFTVVRQNCTISKIWDGKKCTDEDECKTGMAACALQARCKDTPGFYKCECKAGLKGKNPRTEDCKDVNECENKKNCHKDAICENTFGSFSCHCKRGFKDGRSGRFSCKCRYGFWGDATKKCEAQTPCLRALPHCDVPIKAECRHLPDNTFECVCKPGFTGDGFLIECVDVDECLNKEDYCSKHAVCSNLLGSFSCQCKDGFKGNGFECEDINECDSNNNKCPPNSNCVNTNGSFTCKCQSGFTGENPHKECLDLDECTLDRICDYGQRCTNTHGSYKCSCDQGYYLIDVAKNKCEDIDECSNLTMPCGRHNFIRCENTDGDYLCRCDQGFQFDKEEKQCKDIDECKTGEWPCAEDATCNNLQGSFRCTCPKGYHGDGEYICIANRSSLNGVTWITVVALVVAGLLLSPLRIIF